METTNNNINVDELLQELDMLPSESNPSPSLPPSDDSTSSFSDEDIDDILEENGFSEEAAEDIDDTDSQESQSEGAAADAEALERIGQQINEITEEYVASHSNPIAEETENSWDEDDEEERTTETVVENLWGDEEEEDEEETTSENNSEEDLTALPLNSPTLLIDESTSRFSGAEWFQEIQKARIIVAGCGGIGSNLIFQLARMAPAGITIYDDDTVERVNMAGQLFSIHDLTKAKVNAIADMVYNYTNMSRMQAIKARFEADTEAGDIMMCGFDNMAARKIFFNAWKSHVESKPVEERNKCLFLDGRLSIDTLQILCIKGDDSYNMKRYSNEFLFLDSQADATVCSMKQTTYLACMIGSLMVNLFTNFVAGTLDPVIPYDLPFFTEYDAQNMLFKTEN